MICLLSQVNPKADPIGSSATYCSKTCGKTINAKNALSLWVLPRLPDAISHGNNAAKADF